MPLLRVVPVIALVLVAGCGGTSSSADKPTKAASSSSAPATPTQAVPQVGQCYDLDYKSATSATSSSAPVPCTQPHTTVTVYVGQIDAIDDGHLLAVDSDAVQNQLATACPRRVAGWVGADQDRMRLSRLSAIWFTPSLSDADAGATWFRCDVVAVASDNTLAPVRFAMRGALRPDNALDTWGTCGTAAPSEKTFTRVICSAKHTWQAVSVLPIAKDAAYLGKAAQATADDACKLQAQQRASDPLSYKWSFEWPSKTDWDNGQRYGLCWVPS